MTMTEGKEKGRRQTSKGRINGNFENKYSPEKMTLMNCIKGKREKRTNTD